ncbi:MAG: AzlD domain-containing protein [Rhizobacter sp.]|nr:AzlD domain-containing protein [Burkholderiales bacterium]
MNWGGFGTLDGWLAIVGLAIGTFAIRYSFIGLLAGKKLPPRFERALQLAVPAIFAALVVPLILFQNNQLNLAMRWPHAVAAIITGIYAGWRGGMLVSLLIGMACLHTLLWFFP